MCSEVNARNLEMDDQLSSMFFALLIAVFVFLVFFGYILSLPYDEDKERLDRDKKHKEATVQSELKSAKRNTSVEKTGKLLAKNLSRTKKKLLGIEMSNFQQKIVFSILIFALIMLGYYLTSPYQRCIRQGEGELYCLRETSW